MNSGPMKLLYDGSCPFCRRAACWFREHDQGRRLRFEDITSPQFHAEDYGLSDAAVQKELHGVFPDGSVVRGAEAVRRACEAIGLNWLASPTRLPGLRTLTDAGYRVVARSRMFLGRFFGRKCLAEQSCPRGSR